MAQQQIVWTVLPHGRVEKGEAAGRLQVSVVVSPRLTPQSPDEQALGAFPEFLDWPATLGTVKMHLQIGGQTVPLEPLTKADSGLWTRLFTPVTPVAGFEFRNMAQVNLRSFAVRNVLGLLRRHYGRLAVQAAGTHPTLLPWSSAHPNLKDLLTELGTRTQKINFGDRTIEVPLPGFDRFFDDDNPEGLETRLRDLVFGPRSRFRGLAAGAGVDRQGNPTSGGDFVLRALPPDWTSPSGGGASAPVMSQYTSASEYTMYQANRFYRREPLTAAKRSALKSQGQLRRPKLVGVPPSPQPPDFDFHRIVASFADLPMLLRALGLLIDCALPADSPIDQFLATSPQAQGVMGLELAWAGGHTPSGDSCPRTAWIASKTRFTTRPRTTDHDRGLLRLQQADDRWHADKKTNFDVYQVDADGAALKTVNFLLTAQNLVARSLTLGAAGEVTYTTGDRQPVSALRSGGLGVSRHGRAIAIAQSAAAAALKDQAIRGGAASSRNVVLFTEDVLRGYRVDVLPMPDGPPGTWHSLCARSGTYRYIGSPDTLSLPDDEGYVKGASTTSTAHDDVDPDDHYLHESLFRWTGWSLAAPRPGRTLRDSIDSASGVQGESPEDVNDEASSGNGLAVTFAAVKGSLPRLRFGVPYRFRARIVDLAGNSLAIDNPSLDQDVNVTAPVTYWRFEPVDPPALVHRARVSEGESLERMVIRSNWNADPAAYLTTPAFAAARALPASADFDYTAINERHAVPPKSAQLQCEQHGVLDALFTDPAGIKQAYAISARESGTLYDAGPTTQIELVTPASLTGIATTTAVPPALPTPQNPTGDRMAPGQYVVHRETSIATPYLPDPAAGGVAVRAMPGHALPGVSGPMVLGPSAMVIAVPNQEPVLVVAFANDWPDTRGFRIVLAERTATLADLPCAETFPDAGPPAWDETARVLTFFVPKGRIVRLRYASFVHKAFIGAFGLPDWTDSSGDAHFVRAMAQVGAHWMVTPYRALTLVHATQQPVCQPMFLSLTPQRNIGDQHATLIARVHMHGPSTGKFEVEAEWQEWVDDPQKEGPELITSRGQLGEISLAENHINEFSLSSAVNAQQPNAPGQPRARGDRHELGDTKFRLLHYSMRATTRFREYLPEALYEQRDEVTRVGPVADGPAMQVGAPDDPGAPVLPIAGQALHTPVLSSAEPDEPRVIYVLPTFRWLGTPGATTLDTTRLGNGLRVWLERPWFSSGDGELLGVIILGENTPFTDIPSELVPFVTQWGLDPLWDTALPKHRTRVSDFPGRVRNEVVSLREHDTSVQVVGHRVRWDGARRAWYCDVELEPGGSYMPFVRLALVRYQPNALAGTKISKVLLTDFAQVLPRRRSVFTRSGGQVAFRMYGTVPQQGPMQWMLDSQYLDVSFVPPFGLGETGRNKVDLVLQTRDPAIESDLAWTDASVLGSTIVAPAGAVLEPVPFPVPFPVLSESDPGTTRPGPASSTTLQPGRTVDLRMSGDTPASVRDSLGRRLDFASAVDLGNITVAESPNAVDTGILGPIVDPAIWETTVTLPNVSDKPARLVVREYERYYTDRFVPEMVGGTMRQRRVVEERLVYTAFFDL
jgi:hypothetical protein